MEEAYEGGQKLQTYTNTVWKEFETTLKARLKHVVIKDKWWADKVRAGDTSQPHANQAMTKMRAEATEAKVVLIEWNTPESISPDTKEAIGKWYFKTSGNDADIAAMPRPCKFPRWNYKWKISTYCTSGGDGREFFFPACVYHTSWNLYLFVYFEKHTTSTYG